ncbi:MAG: L-histidine N(alpha)-methyltransferase [Thermonemataceae bacterium]
MQVRTENNRELTAFESDVLTGFSSTPKHLPSKYFYDDEGSRLFQEIMHLPEYYLTRAEYEILETHTAAILARFLDKKKAFNLIELGAGDGLKTKLLLKYFVAQKVDFRYAPIDISAEALQQLTQNVTTHLPTLKVQPIEGDYFTALRQVKVQEGARNVVLFLGSNIGNFSYQASIDFLSQLKASLQPNDLLLLGFDLKKHPQIILNAYNDASGVTRAFNLNLLKRLNQTLDANFDLRQFDHYPTYDPHSGEARSYLVSKIAQEVHLKEVDETVVFQAGETIHTEISRKYTEEEMKGIAQKAGFEWVKSFTDSNCYFVDAVF